MASPATLPVDGIEKIRDFHTLMSKRVVDYIKLCNENPIFKARLGDVGYLDLAGCMALGITGPILRSTGSALGPPQDAALPRLRRASTSKSPRGTPVTHTARFRIRLEEMVQSLRIVEQVIDRLEAAGPGPVMVDDPKIALAGADVDRLRRPRQQPRAHRPHHERVDGGTDPSLQAGDRRFRGSCRSGVRRRRVASR